MSVDLGLYMIEGFQFNLYLNLNFDVEGNYFASILLPNNYPSTIMSQHPLIKQKGLFQACITKISPQDRTWWRLFCKQKTGSDCLVIKIFNMIPKLFGLYLTPKEAIILKGLGRKCMFIMLDYLVNRCSINPHDTMIMLEASGGTVITREDITKVNYYLSLGRNEMMLLYRNMYPESYERLYPEFIYESDKDIATLIVSIQNNEKLIHYYKNVFGLYPLEYISSQTIMGAPLSMVLDYLSVSRAKL